jgi:hypothetical protein
MHVLLTHSVLFFAAYQLVCFVAKEHRYLTNPMPKIPSFCFGVAIAYGYNLAYAFCCC